MGRGGGSRGGGSFGGGRSFGGGGGRSFGGRSGGLGSPGRGGGKSGGTSGLGGSFGRPSGGSSRPVVRPVIFAPMMFGRRRNTTVFYGGGPGHGGGSGCMSVLVVFALVIIILTVMNMASSTGAGSVTRSTVNRTPLPAGHVVETEYFTDELGWIGNHTVLTAGMRNFYQRTGVQPHLFITDSIYGSANPSLADAERFAQEKYDELFVDEAHLLVIFFEPVPNRYNTWYTGGRMAKTVLDDEAMDILLDYIDRYYEYDLTDEQFFSKAFDDASLRIMEVTTSPWIPVFMIGGTIALAAMLILWWSRAKMQKNLEAEQTREILNTPLEKFGSGEADDLAKKYED